MKTPTPGDELDRWTQTIDEMGDYMDIQKEILRWSALRAPLWALYGDNAKVWEAIRKNKWQQASQTQREAYAARGEKITEASLEQLGHLSDAHQSFLNGSTAERTQLAILDAMIAYCEARARKLRSDDFQENRR